MEEIIRIAAEESDGPPPEWLTFSGVALAMPGEDGFAPGGPVVRDGPGRYLLRCFIPTGADPAALEEAMDFGEEPQARRRSAPRGRGHDRGTVGCTAPGHRCIGRTERLTGRWPGWHTRPRGSRGRSR